MDAYTLELKKLLADHQAPQVMKSLMETLGEASLSSQTLKAEIEPLQSEIIMLSSRLSRINKDREQNLIDHNNFGIELARFEKSILGILNGLDENYPGLEKYFQEKDEEAAWATASASNDIQTYETFFSKYPNGKYKAETQRIIQELKSLEVQKNIEIRKTAEEERKRRQTTESVKKPVSLPTKESSSGNTKYILIAVGIFASVALIYFLSTLFNTDSPDVKKSEARAVPTESLIPSTSKDLELVPTRPVEVKQSLTATSSKLVGSWESDKGRIQLKTSGNRVYGDLGSSALIEAVFDPNSQTVRGQLIEGNKKTTLAWAVEGWTLLGKETWVFTDKQRTLTWNGKKLDSKEPNLIQFSWEGIWKTNNGTARFSQKGNIVTGSFRGDQYTSGSIRATYNPSTKRLKGQILSKPFPASFEISMQGGNTFSGPGQFSKKVLVPVLQPITWKGKKIK